MDVKVDGITLTPGVDEKRIQIAVREILIAIGEDPDRAGLMDTPARVARYWKEFIDYNPGTLTTMFDEKAPDGPVIVSGMRVHSLCEHHLLPFWCDVTVAYIPKKQVIGLSKIARIAHLHAHQLQLQERLVTGIAQQLSEISGSEDVMVVATGEHSCMVQRGIRTAGLMSSRDCRGQFHRRESLRAEVLAQHQSKR